MQASLPRIADPAWSSSFSAREFLREISRLGKRLHATPLEQGPPNYPVVGTFSSNGFIAPGLPRVCRQLEEC